MTTVFFRVPIGERIGTRLGQPDRIIQLAIGQQRGIGGDRGTAKLQQQTMAEKSSLSASLVDSPTGFSIATRLAVSKALNPYTTTASNALKIADPSGECGFMCIRTRSSERKEIRFCCGARVRNWPDAEVAHPNSP